MAWVIAQLKVVFEWAILCSCWGVCSCADMCICDRTCLRAWTAPWPGAFHVSLPLVLSENFGHPCCTLL